MNDQCWTLWMRGCQLAEMDRWSDAFRMCRQAIVADVEAADPHGLMALILLENGYAEKAIVEALEACRLEPGGSENHRLLAMSYAYCRSFEEAHEELALALELDPHEPANYVWKARILAIEESWKACEESCREGLVLDPDHEQLLVVLSHALGQQGRSEESREVIERALHLDPESAAGQRLLGQALIGQGQVEEAGLAFRESLRQDPDQDDWWYDQALKGAKWWYRPFLRFTLTMARLPRLVALTLVVGLWAGHLWLSRFSEDHPGFRPYGTALSVAYIVFVLYTWLADPMANFILRRQGLSR
jgi:tetratricopeptide (TPR) repeat protein